ncbi:ferredoxin-type protein NapG [Thalassotalea sp. G2M2-11]|uniref:ferredoxin-type protein NapG n=1 Tax=Thalassotalea sp. G2M2-11 TaxID=2787627 RepID=UPI0019D0292A|nr:ferredoxin-type protein NapG [Thalassotalea sp. G2M2-11]
MAKSKKVSRRQFIINSTQVACAAGVATSFIGGYAAQANSSNAQALRPPGALTEQDFLSACARCGLCVQACPYDTLKLASWLDEAPNGTPYFDARNIPCEMCDDIPCVPACPTGALDHELTNIDDAKMGIAVIVDRSTCLNINGLRCDICYNVCPVRDKAITLEKRQNPRIDYHAILEPVVHADACTGCGKCEHACITEQASIKVLPIELAKGKMQNHYQLYWQTEQADQLNKQPDLPKLNMAKPE